MQLNTIKVKQEMLSLSLFILGYLPLILTIGQQMHWILMIWKSMKQKKHGSQIKKSFALKNMIQQLLYLQMINSIL